MGSADLKAAFGPKKHEVNVSTYQVRRSYILSPVWIVRLPHRFHFVSSSTDSHLGHAGPPASNSGTCRKLASLWRGSAAGVQPVALAQSAVHSPSHV